MANDHSTLPPVPEAPAARRLLRYPQLMEMFGGVSLSTIKRVMKHPNFPAPVPITGKINGWFEDQVLVFMADRQAGLPKAHPRPQTPEREPDTDWALLGSAFSKLVSHEE